MTEITSDTQAGEAHRFPDWPIPDDAVNSVFRQLVHDGSWGRYHGPHCDALRQQLAGQFQAEHVHLCSSGTAAIELSLRGAGVTSGDEVLLADYDFKANFVNVLLLGATPVLVDTIADEPTPDLAAIAAAISERTKAVIVSHLHGCLSPIRELRELAESRGVIVIEDVCQCPGARIAGRMAGAWGHVAAFSFGGSKLLTAGRGGAVLTSDATIVQRIRLYTQRGNEAYPLSEMQAAVLIPQLQSLAARNRVRESRVSRLAAQLSPQHLTVVRAISDDASSPAFYKVAVLLRADCDRDQLQQICGRLRNAGVAVDPAFPALHLTHSARRFRAVSGFPHATRFHNQLMILHHPVLLMEEPAIDRVAELLNRAAAGMC